jgi:hypothetical protein
MLDTIAVLHTVWPKEVPMANLVQLLNGVDDAAGRLRSALNEGFKEEEIRPFAAEYACALSRYRDALMLDLVASEQAD